MCFIWILKLVCFYSGELVVEYRLLKYFVVNWIYSIYVIVLLIYYMLVIFWFFGIVCYGSIDFLIDLNIMSNCVLFNVLIIVIMVGVWY